MTAISETVLVTGGLGYIGSHVCDMLLRLNHNVIVLDNLSNSHKNRLQHGCKFYFADIREDIRYIFENNPIDRVIHLAALKSVPDSETMKDEYYSVNVLGTQNLLQCMNGYCDQIEFASSASVYGNTMTPANEQDPLDPQSYYGKTKILGEKLIRDSGYDYAIFRYFNPIGFHHHLPDTGKNLFPLLIDFAAKGKTFTVFGDEFKTEDGTCSRDYIDVRDMVKVHTMNLRGTYNVASGKQTTVKQMISTFNNHSPQKLEFQIGPARNGDPGVLAADCGKLFATGFEIKTDLDSTFRKLFQRK